MARHNEHITRNLDWLTVLIYATCVIWGLFSIYAAIYNPENPTKLFDLSNSAGKQLMFISTSMLLIIAILVIDHRFWETFGEVIYWLCIVSLVAVLFLGANVKGSHSWFKLGSFSLQPAEFAKIGTSLMLARYLSHTNANLAKFKDMLWVAGIVLLPAVLILVSHEMGVMLVFASFMFVLYREGIRPIYPVVFLSAIVLFMLTLFFSKLYIIGALAVLGLLVYRFIIPHYERSIRSFWQVAGVVGLMALYVGSTDFIFNNLLEKHQKMRILVLINPYADPRKAGWNVIQSKIAIGTGQLWGKGYLQGTQTKFDFVPEQHTDFIFCTIGEEHGFMGCLLLVCLLLGLVVRIVVLAERQRTRFARVFGYCLAGVLFFHFLVNLGMTIGFMPVIGIPLPFFSYGGSSLWGFTVFLFIFLKLDAQRPFTLARD
jgi:rod shape determining protein RodA